jgi:putative hydrolase of the HAD superfamily
MSRGAARPLRQLTWLFDLDNTLHDASHAIFPAINVNMNALIARVLDAEQQPAHPEAVNAVRLAYWQRYGATLLGMMRHHAVRAEDFLRDAHRFDDLPQMIRAERGVGRLLKRLPGKKILLTNAPSAYSHAVLRHLGLHRHFAAHLPIESMMVHRQLRPKPSRLLLRKLLAREGVRARDCVLVEDTVQNLKAAKSLGMRTVWSTQYLGKNPARPRFVDVKVKSVRQLPKQLHRL